jgi:DNA-binding beta-propeller fold protein YncE
VTYQAGAPAASHAIALSPDGSTVYVTGSTEQGFGNTERFATLAYDAATGDAVWAANFPGRDTGEHGLALTIDVSRDGSMVVVSGWSRCKGECTATHFEGFTTIVYDASTGSRLWVSRMVTTGGGPQSVAFSPDGSTVLVAGDDGLDGNHVVAYDSSTGEQRWKVDRQHGTTNTSGGALAVSPDSNLVFVTDTAPDGESTCFWTEGYRTTAFEVATGAIAWSALYQVNAEGTICGTPSDIALSPDGSKLYVTGYRERPGHLRSGLFQAGTVAYDAATGTQLWATNDDEIRVLSGSSITLGIDPGGSTLFILGDDCREYPSCHFQTIAHDTTSGDRLWASGYDGGGRSYPTDLAVSPDGSSVFVTGQETMPCLAGCVSSDLNAPLVSYDASSGALRWATTYPNNIAMALAVSPDSGSVYLAGTLTTSASTALRAKTPGSGRVALGCTPPQCGYSVSRVNTRPGPGAVQDADTSMRYDGWRGVFEETAVGGAYRTSSDAGATATFRTPPAKALTWLTRRGPNQGKARISIDGRSRGVVNLYAATPSPHAVSFDGLERRAHVVEVQVLGKKSTSSRGTWVAVDGFEFKALSGIVQESSPKVGYDHWAGRSHRRASGGSFRISSSPASRMSLGFKGRSVVLLTATGPAYGRAKVSIDGKVHVVDLYAATRHWRAKIAFTGLTKGRHHITIRPAGTKNPAARSAKVIVDALRIG